MVAVVVVERIRRVVDLLVSMYKTNLHKKLCILLLVLLQKYNAFQ
jgi:hypothetical protein